MSKSLTITASELYAGIGFHCQKILSNIAQHAAGAPFPPPEAIQEELDRMVELTMALKTMQIQPANSEAA